MSFSERQLEDDGAVGRKIVEVSGFRVGEDDDGIEVMSPGLAVSPPDCHCFRNYRHVTCFVDLGWTSGWRPHYSN